MRAQLARVRGALEAVRRHRAATAELPPREIANPAENRERPIAQIPELSAVQAGSLRVGETEIAIDPDRDSLDDVAKRITDTAIPPVIARVDPETLVLSIARKDPRAELVLGDDTSQLFRSVRMTPATYQAVDAVIRPRPVFHDVGGMRRDVFELRRALDALMSASLGNAAADAAARERVRQSVMAALAHDSSAGVPAGPAGARFGLGLERAEGERALRVDEAAFARAAEEDAMGLHAFLFGDEGVSDGFVGQLVREVEDVQRANAPENGPGQRIDLFA